MSLEFPTFRLLKQDISSKGEIMSKYTDLAMERRSRITPEGRPARNRCQAVMPVFAEDAGYDGDARMKAATCFRGGELRGGDSGRNTGDQIK